MASLPYDLTVSCAPLIKTAEALNSYFYSFFKEELPAPFKGNSQSNFISDLKISVKEYLNN